MEPHLFLFGGSTFLQTLNPNPHILNLNPQNPIPEPYTDHACAAS